VEVDPEQRHGQSVRPEPPGQGLQLRVRAHHPCSAQERTSRLRRDLLQVARREAGPAGQVRQRLSRGDKAQATRSPGQTAKQGFQGRVTELAFVESLPGLERLHAVQYHQGTFRTGQTGQAFALVPRRSGCRVPVAKETQGGINKRVRRGHPFLSCTLAVERPAEDPRRSTEVVSLHVLEPVVDQRGLAHAAISHKGQDAGLGLPGFLSGGPGLVE